MRKLFVLFALVAMYSCGPATIKNKTEQDIFEEYDRIVHFTYKGHKYIKFEKPYRMGIVHDPDCACHNK